MTSNTPRAYGDESSHGKPPPLEERRPHEGEPPETRRAPQRSETLDAELAALEATLPDESLNTKNHHLR